jgi:hypothetical protein
MGLHRRTRSLAIAFAGLAIASCASAPDEPDLPAVAVGIPPGWQGTIGVSKNYEIGLYRTDRHGGRSSAYIDGPLLFTPEVGILEQLVRADNYRGRRMRLSAWVKGHGIVGPIAGLWMRVDGAGVVTGYDNMANRAEHGTTDWHQVSVVLDVPADALGIVIGAMLQGGGTFGSGTLFIDDMKLEVVGTDVPSTNLFDAPKPNAIDPATTIATYLNAGSTPANLDFERVP